MLLKRLAKRLRDTPADHPQLERLIGCIVHENIIDPPIPSAERLGQLFELVPLLDMRLLSRLLEEGLTDRLLKVLTLTTRDNYDKLVARILRKIGERLQKESPLAYEQYMTRLHSQNVNADVDQHLKRKYNS